MTPAFHSESQLNELSIEKCNQGNIPVWPVAMLYMLCTSAAAMVTDTDKLVARSNTRAGSSSIVEIACH